MGVRGRRSAADLATVAPLEPRIGRPPPPADLTPEQAAEWRAVVERMPADWFRREHFAVLASYCRHVTRARLIEATLAKADAAHPLDAEAFAHFDKLAHAAERETRALLACARSLRLTHQSQDRRAAGRLATERSGPRPWEFGRSEAS